MYRVSAIYFSSQTIRVEQIFRQFRGVHNLQSLQLFARSMALPPENEKLS